MQELSINSFFSLEDYPYADLFEGCTFAWEALGRLAAYLEAKELGKIESEIPSSVYLVNRSSISIGSGVLIEPGAYIEGPCIIGPGSTIRHGAYIRGNVITGTGCVIGHDTEVKHSILLNQVCASHFNYVGDCILGNRVNLGAGVKCANLRLDHLSVSISYKGQRMNTNLTKMGAVIGDGAQLGCNCVTNPGTLMGKKSFAHPCINVSGFVPASAIVKPPFKSIIEDVHANLSK